MKTTIKEIVQYWSLHKDESELGVDWLEAHERCWRCAYKRNLERCHIVPDSLGGADHPSNLVLLCKHCHREAPNIADSRFMWIWIRETCKPFYDTYWRERGIEEFEKMFKRKPFFPPEKYHMTQEEVEVFMKEEMEEEVKKVIVHFGEGMLNPSTYACLFARWEEKIIMKQNNKK
jgi:hypothetical protein